jgi:hypothetical protein
MSKSSFDRTLDDVIVLDSAFDDIAALAEAEAALHAVYPQLADAKLRERAHKSLLRLFRAGLIEITWFKHVGNEIRRIEAAAIPELLVSEEAWHPTSFLVEHVRFSVTERGHQAFLVATESYRAAGREWWRPAT